MINGTPLRSRAELIRAVARAHWRPVQAALDRDAVEGYPAEVWHDFEDPQTGELIDDGGH